MNYLKEILIDKKKNKPDISQKAKVKGKGFGKNFSKDKINIIAEIKAASPSRGVINKNLNKAEAAYQYGRHPGFIKGISVLTEPLYFKGCADDVAEVKKSCGLPVLRKDFITYPAQVYESACLGADCILLIAGLLGEKRLKYLYRLAKSLGLEVLVEAHNSGELEKAIKIGAGLVGINNRNLKDLRVNRDNAVSVIEKSAEDGITFISESGIGSLDDILSLYEKGIRNFLIGTYFMRAKSLEVTLDCMEIAFKKKGLI
ncbi:MAG: indole-3-glycerol phosphate synthase TrpC [Actinomycetota bacterium]